MPTCNVTQPDTFVGRAIDGPAVASSRMPACPSVLLPFFLRGLLFLCGHCMLSECGFPFTLLPTTHPVVTVTNFTILLVWKQRAGAGMSVQKGTTAQASTVSHSNLSNLACRSLWTSFARRSSSAPCSEHQVNAQEV